MRFNDGHFVGWGNAPSPGVSCSPACASLIFAQQYASKEPDEMALEAWRWRYRRAQSHGLPFNEPAPLTRGGREWGCLRAQLEALAYGRAS